MTLKARLNVYEPNGAALGVLPVPQDVEASFPLGDTGALAFTYARTAPRAAWLDTPKEIAVEVSHDGGATWAEPMDARFRMLRREGDPTDQAELVKRTALGYRERLTKARILPEGKLNKDGKRAFLSSNAGRIMSTLIQEAQTRGALTGMAYDFTGTTDSNGAAWSKQVTLYFEPGLDYLAVLQNLEDQGLVEVATQGRTLRLFNPDGVRAVDRSVGAEPVILRQGRDVLEAPYKGTLENLADYAFLAGDDGYSLEVNNTTALKPWGRQETYIAQGGVSDSGTAALLAMAELDLGARERVENSYGLVFTGAKFLPFRNYQSGDYVLVDTNGSPERLRVRQVTLALDTAGNLTGAAILNDRFVEAEIRQARRVQGITGGSSAGGTGAAPATTVDKRTPKAPTAAPTATTAAYLTPDGTARAQVTLTWAAVTEATDGTAQEIGRYEVQGRTSGGLWGIRTSTDGDDLNANLSDLDPNRTWEYRVRAVGKDSGKAGAWSPVRTILLAKDTTPPEIPMAPVLSSRRAVVTVTQAGTDATGVVLAPDTRHIELSLGTASNSTPNILGTVPPGGGAITVPGLEYDVTYWVRARAMDRSENWSGYSTAVSITVEPMVDADLIGTTLEERLSSASDDATQALADAAAAATTATTAGEAAAQAQADATAAGSVAATAAGAAATANTAATEAAAAAAAANTQALAAAGLADAKGRPWIQSTAPLAGISHNWSGTANASASVQKRDGVEIRRNLAPNPGMEASTLSNWIMSGATGAVSTEWARTGTRSARLVANGTNAGDLRMNGSSATTFPAGMVAGGTYTVSAYVNRPVASGTVHGRSLRILYFYSLNGSSYTEVFGPQAPNVTGTQRLSHTFTIPANATGVVLGIGVAGSSGLVTYVDDVLVEASATLGDYFDGDTPDEREKDLWIDTTGGANTPKRWNRATDAWVAVTDKAATDAASAAATAQGAASAAASAASAAQGTANDAATAASQAQADADAAATAASNAASAAAAAQAAADQAQEDATTALTAANGKNTSTYSVADPPGTYDGAVGDTWWKWEGPGTIIGQWSWDGAAWDAQTIGSEVIANLDVGKLVASAASLGTAVAQKFAAETAEFLEARAEWFGANKIEADWIGFGAIQGEHIGLGAVPPNRLSVGIEEIVPNPKWMQPEWDDLYGPDKVWRDDAQTIPDAVGWGWDTNPVNLRFGQTKQLIVWGDQATQNWSKMPVSDLIPTQGGDKWYISADFFRGSAGGAGTNPDWYMQFFPMWFDAAGARISPANNSVRSDQTGVADRTWGNQERVVTAPAGAVSFRLILEKSNTNTASYIMVGAVSCRRVLQGSSASGRYAELSPIGVRLYDDDGAEVVSLTSLPPNYLAIKGSGGESLAGINDQGVVSGLGLNIAGDPEIMGTPLVGPGLFEFDSPASAAPGGLLEVLPRGVVARGFNNVQARTVTAGEVALGELTFTVQPGRMYQIIVEPLGVYVDPSSYGYLNIRNSYGTAPASPNFSSPLARRFAYRPQTATGTTTPILNMGGSFYHFYDDTVTKARLLITLSINTGTCTVYDSPDGGTLRVYVLDIGPKLEDVLVNRTLKTGVSETAPAEKKSYTKTYTATGYRSYEPDGSTYNYNTSKMYQGDSPVKGELQSIAILPSMTGDLSGATITSVRAYFYFEHWYYNSGGTARIGMHGQSSLPSTRPTITQMASSSSWPKPGGRWVNIPSTYWAGIKSGTYKGLALGDGSGSLTEYGYARGSSTKLEIKYTK